jgi:hypothetical protein
VVVVSLIGLAAGFLFFWFDLTHHRDSLWISWLEHLLAIIAILAGGLAVLFEIRLHAGFEKQKQDIELILNSAVLTRYVDKWPLNLRAITDLVADARPGDELLVLADPLAYAHLSAPDLFVKYLDALQAARARNVAVKILTPDEDGLRNSIDIRFASEKNEPAKPCESFNKIYKNKIGIGINTYEGFVTGLLWVQCYYCRSLVDSSRAKAAEVRVLKRTQPEEVLYWIVRRDDMPQSVIFSYQRFSGLGTGYAFRTAVRELMLIFSTDFDKKWEQSKNAHIRLGEDLYPKAWHEVQSWSKKSETDQDGHARGQGV